MDLLSRCQHEHLWNFMLVTVDWRMDRQHQQRGTSAVTSQNWPHPPVSAEVPRNNLTKLRIDCMIGALSERGEAEASELIWFLLNEHQLKVVTLKNFFSLLPPSTLSFSISAQSQFEKPLMCSLKHGCFQLCSLSLNVDFYNHIISDFQAGCSVSDW